MTAIIELYANNANTVLANSITTSATTITVAPGTGAKFPSPVSGSSFFRITLTGASSPNTVEEICYVTARSGDVFTVLRAQEGTIGVAWAVNDLLYNAVTAGTLNQFLQPYFGVNTGSANAIAISTQNASPVYYTGMPVSFTTASPNTVVNPTLNLNGIGAASIVNATGSALVAGQIQSNTIQFAYYNASDSTWRLQTPSYGQIVGDLGYVPVNKAGDTMTGSLTNASGFVGPLTGNVTGNVSGNSGTTSQTNFSALTVAGTQVVVNSGTWGIGITGNAGTVTNGVYTTSFPSSLTSNGYQKLPGGFIIQWGKATTTGGGIVSVSFPIAFPTSAFQVTLGLVSGSPVANVLGYDNLTTTGFNLFSNIYPVQVNNADISWIAIGY